MATAPEPKSSTANRISPALVGVGVLVIVLGFGLPRLTPNLIPDASAPSVAEKKADPVPVATPAPSSTPEGPGILVSLGRLAGSLVVVSGLCVLAMHLLGRQSTSHKTGMEVIASHPIDARCAIHLVKAGDRRLLIGIDITGVKSILELPRPASELFEETTERPPETAVVEAPKVVSPLKLKVPARAGDTPVVVGPVRVRVPAGAVETPAVVTQVRMTVPVEVVENLSEMVPAKAASSTTVPTVDEITALIARLRQAA